MAVKVYLRIRLWKKEVVVVVGGLAKNAWAVGLELAEGK